MKAAVSQTNLLSTLLGSLVDRRRDYLLGSSMIHSSILFLLFGGEEGKEGGGGPMGNTNAIV